MTSIGEETARVRLAGGVAQGASALWDHALLPNAKHEELRVLGVESRRETP